MPVALLFKKQLASIDTLTLDASLSENHSVEVEVTDHPVEQGVNISDHRRRKPYSVTIEGVVTNTPSKPTGISHPVTSRGHTWIATQVADATASASAYSTLLALADASRLITVITALRRYDNMTITSLSVPRDAKTGQALRFTATLREIRIVRNDTVAISAKTTRAQKTTDLHKKAKNEITPEQQEQTAARYLLGGDAAKDVKDAVGAIGRVLGGQ